MATVKQIAEKLNVSLPEFISKLTNQDPSIKWKSETEVPDEIAQKFVEVVEDYARQTTPAGAIASSDGGAVTFERLAVNAEAIEYGYLEIFAAIDLNTVVNKAIDDAAAEVTTYYAVKGQALQSFIEQRTQAALERQATTATNRTAAGEKRQAFITNSMNSQKGTNQILQKLQEDQQAFLNKMIK